MFVVFNYITEEGVRAITIGLFFVKTVALNIIWLLIEDCCKHIFIIHVILFDSAFRENTDDRNLIRHLI